MLINKFYEVLNISFIMFDLWIEGLMQTLFLALFTCLLSDKSNFLGTMLSKHSSKKTNSKNLLDFFVVK